MIALIASYHVNLIILEVQRLISTRRAIMLFIFQSKLENSSNHGCEVAIMNEEN